MGSRLNVTLPSAAAAISLPLMIWAIFNEHVIASMGMAWDTGAPVWPYETPQILLYALNFPAHVVGQPIANFLGLTAPVHYAVIFPVTLVWWWFLGSQLDCGLLSSPRNRGWQVFSISIALALLLAWAAINAGSILSQWPFRFIRWSDRAISTMMLVAPVLWCFVLASLIATRFKRWKA